MPRTDFYEKYQIGSGHGDKNNRISGARSVVVVECYELLKLPEKTDDERLIKIFFDLIGHRCWVIGRRLSIIIIIYCIPCL